MKIKDVEKQVGISKANIRFYEEEGLIHPARNQENNYREYSEADVEQLQEIKKLRLIGIPVQEIKEIYEDRLTLQEALSRRLDEIEKEERTLGLYRNTSLCRADFTCSCGRSADHRNMFGEYESASDIVASGGSCTACRTFYNRNSDGKRIYCVS